jgi:hypothetical protein
LIAFKIGAKIFWETNLKCWGYGIFQTACDTSFFGTANTNEEKKEQNKTVIGLRHISLTLESTK